MKFSIVQILFSSLVIAQAQEAWFVPSKNATCRGYPDGHIGCEPGHVDNALEFVPQGVPAVRGREPNPLDKRLTCNIDGVTRGLACATHCFAINFCNSHCDSNNICICDCKDETQGIAGIIPCQKTSCA